MIRLRELRVDYDNVCAVRDLSLEVGPGEICGLIGPNGAGKTTTMRAMIGLLEPTYGEIELAGVDIREHPRDACRAERRHDGGMARLPGCGERVRQPVGIGDLDAERPERIGNRRLAAADAAGQADYKRHVNGENRA